MQKIMSREERLLGERERAHALELAELVAREEALAQIGQLALRYALTPGELAELVPPPQSAAEHPLRRHG